MKFALAGLNSIISLSRELTTGLDRLSFEDNFDAYIVEGITIDAGETERIANGLDTIPSKYVIVNQEGGSVIAKSSDSEWTNTDLYLKNYGTEDVTLSIVFMR